MPSIKIPKRVTTALINSLGAGVVPRVGLEHIAVGREKEVAALLQDLDNIGEGGGAFRFIVGRYGAGKSFILQLIRNHAMERGFVVADADLSPERRLVGANGHGVATYRELMQNLSTKIRPDGSALTPILEGWINGIQNQVAQATGMRPNDEGFDDKVEAKILEAIKETEGLVHGFAFATVITTYWRGYRADDDAKKTAALRWLKADFANKIEAKSALGVRDIIEDDSWYDYIKILAKFVADIGYRGLIILLDEAVHLYKISHSISRQNNYDKLLAIFNDTMQGKAEHLGIYIGGTPSFLEDSKRGLFNDLAWKRRTTKSRFTKGFQDTSSPVFQLEALTESEILLLFQRLAEVHTIHYGTEKMLTNDEVQRFLQEVVNRLGAKALLTPGEIVRDFVSVLNILQQNQDLTLNNLLHNSGFALTANSKSTSVDDSEFAEFTL
jgi:P-loop Domain of unknown function (DUF2791)